MFDELSENETCTDIFKKIKILLLPFKFVFLVVESSGHSVPSISIRSELRLSFS